jgi:hypothetical protein
MVSLTSVLRVVPAFAFCGAILLSLCARAPRQAVPGRELRRLVLSALMVYGVGGIASLTGHQILAGTLYGVGITTSALALWLSRGRDQEDPPDGREPVDAPPPPDPDGVPRFEWRTFEREFRDYASRPRQSSRS